MTAGNKDNDVDDDGRLRWRVLLGYGGLALPVAALNLPLYVYLPTFYSAELGLDLAVVGSVLLLARLLDTVIDPVMGELSDRLRTPFGQRRPWPSWRHRSCCSRAGSCSCPRARSTRSTS
jgi:Na+/melibiose symporter-like transporter